MSDTMTLAEAETTLGCEFLDHLDRDVEIPVVDGLAAQGDLIVIPLRMIGARNGAATTPVPADGVPVIRGENGGHTHLLLTADGDVRWDAHKTTDPLDPIIGTLTVADDSQALLSHPEHGGLLIDAGSYEMRRQEETSAVGRQLVAD